MIAGIGQVVSLRLVLAAALLAPIGDLDRTVQSEVQEFRSPGLDPVMKGITDLGKPQHVLAVLLGIACFGGPGGPILARQALLVLLPVNGVVEISKRAVGRTRPDGDSKRSNSSFPSSHAANAAALAFVFGSRWRRAAPLLWALAAAVGCSRIYLNRHFLSDVLVAAAIGVGVAWLVVGWWQRRNPGQAHDEGEGMRKG